MVRPKMSFCCGSAGESSPGWATGIAFSASSRRPSVTLSVVVLPSRNTTTRTVLPTAVLPTWHEATGILDIPAVEGHDHVTGQHAGFSGGAFGHVGHQRACSLFEAHGLGHVIGHVLNAHAEPAAPCLAVFLKLVDHALDHIGGHGKADPDGAAGRAEDGGVHAHHLAVEVEERAARVAPVDGRVGLDVVVIGARQRTVAGRDDPG